MGCPTHPLSSPSIAKAYAESLWQYELNPSPTSQVLAGNIIKSLSNRPPWYTSEDYLVAQARWLCGDELCDALGLKRPTLLRRVMMVGQCAVVCAWVYGAKLWPGGQEKRIQVWKS